jgi:hypothetical protein
MHTRNVKRLVVVLICVWFTGVGCSDDMQPRGGDMRDTGIADLGDTGFVPPNVSYSNYYSGTLDLMLGPDGDGLFDLGASMVLWEQNGELAGTLQFGSDTSDLILWSHSLTGVHRDDGSIRLNLGVPNCRERAAELCNAEQSDVDVAIQGDGELTERAIVFENLTAQASVFGNPSGSSVIQGLRLEPTSYHQTRPVGAGDSWEPSPEGQWEGGALGVPGASRPRVAGFGCTLTLERRIGELHLERFDCGTLEPDHVVDGSFAYNQRRLKWRTELDGSTHVWLAGLEEGGLSGVILPGDALQDIGSDVDTPPDMEAVEVGDVRGAFSLDWTSDGG